MAALQRGVTPQPHKSQEQLGSRQGEKQLSRWVFFFCSFAKLFPLPFCFFLQSTLSSSNGVVCHQSLEPPLSPQHHLFLLSSEGCPRGRRPSWVGSPGIMVGGGAVQGLRCPGRVKTASGWAASASGAGAYCPSAGFCQVGIHVIQ